MSLNIEDNTPFLFKGERIDKLNSLGLMIIQSAKAPCFSLDALLLADFAGRALSLNKNKALKIGDLGSGTGVISLLTAYNLPHSEVFGLEIMAEMADMARRSSALNSLEERVKFVLGDIKRANEFLEAKSFDGIISNPPYEKTSQGRISPCPLMAAAKGEIHCNLEDIISAAAGLLKPKGSFFISQRPKRLGEALELFKKYSLSPKELRFIYPYSHLNAKHFLLQGILGVKCQLNILPPLIVYESRGKYTPEGERILLAPLKEGQGQ